MDAAAEDVVIVDAAAMDEVVVGEADEEHAESSSNAAALNPSQLVLLSLANLVSLFLSPP